MLIRDFRRLGFIIAPLLILAFVTFNYSDNPSLQRAKDKVKDKVKGWAKQGLKKGDALTDEEAAFELNFPPPSKDWFPPNWPNVDNPPPTPIFEHAGGLENLGEYVPRPTFAADAHHLVFSQTTKDKQYFKIDFRTKLGINPNVIPHPTRDDTWIIVAQEHKVDDSHGVFTEITCEAMFESDGALRCLAAPKPLPIAATFGDKCHDELAYIGLNVGPHDARVLYGPHDPYIVFGSNSMHTCFGQWIQDFRVLVDWGGEKVEPRDFRNAVDMSRPIGYRAVEKNWFPFWDRHGTMYIHYDVQPQRVFAQLDAAGLVVGDDLASQTRDHDAACMRAFLPTVGPELESIHQATNSLSITMCKRLDPGCSPTDDNTFVFSIFQHKSFYDLHSEYEPYVMMFQQNAPFALHGFSKKPIWIHGRGATVPRLEGFEGLESEHHTQMLYVTSMSWKNRGQKYHGYLDDPMFLAFGIEDGDTGGIDILAGDILGDDLIGNCVA